MDRISFLPFFLQSFPEGFVILALGLTWTSAKIRLVQLALISFFSTLFSYVIRWLPLVFGIHTVLHFLFLILMIRILLKQTWGISILAVLLGSVAMGIAESIIDPVILKLSGITLDALFSNPWLRVIVPLPHIILLGLLAWLSRRRDWTPISLSNTLKPSQMKRGTLFLLIISLLQGLLIVALNLAVYVYNTDHFSTAELTSLLGTASIILLTAVLTTVIIAYYMLQVSRREALLEENSRHLEAMQELYLTVRAHKHDFFNHITSLYGFLKIGEFSTAQKYIETLYKEIEQNYSIMDIGIPTLSGLLHTKAAMARQKRISFDVSIDPGFTSIPLNAVDLTGVLGNLIDNAMDAVILDNPPTPLINVDLLYNELEGNYLIEVSNTGKALTPELMQKMFIPGFSTKDKVRHSGLGLNSVKNIVNRYSGQIEVDYTPLKSVFMIRVRIPQKTTDLNHFPKRGEPTA